VHARGSSPGRRGFGREWAIAALERGENVAATARDTGSLEARLAQWREWESVSIEAHGAKG